ncbi:MAG: hypothetical protein ACW9W4_08635 [Candidatus Nitrosopumilus sp. bin_7KS]
MKTRSWIIIGIMLLGFGITLHFYFLSLDIAYFETYLNSSSCKIILSQIFNDLNESLENNCPVQLHLIQSVFVKLFLGLGVILIIGHSLMYSGEKENEN